MTAPGQADDEELIQYIHETIRRLERLVVRLQSLAKEREINGTTTDSTTAV